MHLAQSGNEALGKLTSFSQVPVTAAASRFRLLFSRDSADAYNPGVESYGSASRFAAMDIDGSGKKAIIMSILDTARGGVTTYYYSQITFQPVQIKYYYV